MAKYRNLTLEELSHLDDEFISFLVVNGITADDWEKLKKEDMSSAEKVIESFSDVVFEKIMRQTRYLERFGANEYATIACVSHNFHMITIKCSDDEYNLNSSEDIQSLLKVLPDSVEIYTSEKSYPESRELAIWELMNSGFSKSDGNHYLSLIDYLAPSE